jgi:hypothetical protein
MTHQLEMASMMANNPAATKISPTHQRTSPPTMTPTMRQIAPITPRAMRPGRSRFGRKNLLIKLILPDKSNIVQTGQKATLFLSCVYGFMVHKFFVRFGVLERRWQRLFHLWLEAKGSHSVARGHRYERCGLFGPRLAYVPDLHSVNVWWLVAGSPGVLR